MVQMVADDLLGAAERGKCPQPQDVRAFVALHFPEPLHDERQVRRLDVLLRPAAVCDAASCEADIDLSARDLIEDGLHQLRLDLDTTVWRHSVVLLDRSDNRFARGVSIEMFETKRVRKQARDPRLEAVESGQRILAQGQEEVRAES